MFVTMIRAVVARALQEATAHSKLTLNLLADRYYVRNILCHDSSKTSPVEASAYSGIFAVHLEMEYMEQCNKRARSKGVKSLDDHVSPRTKDATLGTMYAKSGDILTTMANLGFKHHYENNSHHIEHFEGGAMDELNLV